MSTFAQLEADLFLAERAFKRVPSDENKAALAKVKEAFEKLQEGKDAILEQPKAPVVPKAKTPKAASTVPAKPAVSKTAAAKATTAKTEDSKKN